MTSQNIHLYLTSEHACGYFEGRKATNLVPDPSVSMTLPLYSQLIELGYRRSGNFIASTAMNASPAGYR
jgi:leucyl-tRNA---protein transferase